MRCSRCRSVLSLVRTEKHYHSVQLWYQCPMCWHQQFVSAPVAQICAVGGDGFDPGVPQFIDAGTRATTPRAARHAGWRGVV